MTLTQLHSFAERHKISIDYHYFKTLKAISFPYGWIALNKAKIETIAEEKTIIAHELGHVITGSFYCDSTPLETKERCEYKANSKAIQMIVPLEKLKLALLIGAKETHELAEHFETTDDFMVKAIEYYKSKELL